MGEHMGVSTKISI